LDLDGIILVPRDHMELKVLDQIEANPGHIIV